MKTSFDLWVNLFEDGNFSETGGTVGWHDWPDVVIRATEPPEDPVAHEQEHIILWEMERPR